MVEKCKVDSHMQCENMRYSLNLEMAQKEYKITEEKSIFLEREGKMASKRKLDFSDIASVPLCMVW